MNNKYHKKTKLLAVCSLFSALGVVILYAGALIEVIDLSMAFVASLIVAAAVIEMGGAYPWLIYSVTSVISVLLLPNKFCALVYLAFAGFYPIVKEKLERAPGILCLVFKFAVFNACLALMWGITKALSLPVTFGLPLWTAALLLNGLFIIFDVALTRLITAYVFKWRKKFKIEKWLS